jgi:kynureninase
VSFRDRFEMPEGKIYLCSNSLGLPAKLSKNYLDRQFNQWKEFGAAGWFSGERWSLVNLSSSLANLLGAKGDEVVVMNSLTINLHLMMASFYQPTKERFKILVDKPIFPSDLYALKSYTHEILFYSEEILQEEGEKIALVLLNPVNYLTGAVTDVETITKLAQEKGCIVGLDVAHAAGNIPLKIHDWNIDFAVGCSYKYLCGGPGAPGFAFVHSKHHKKNLPRLAGWWGNDPATRFKMGETFEPAQGASGWQVSTPPILAMMPLMASLEIFEEAGMERLHEYSKKQTAYLMQRLDPAMVVPSEVRGCQLSILLDNAKEVVSRLENKGIICDFREPNILRVAPSPLYNTFEELDQFLYNL